MCPSLVDTCLKKSKNPFSIYFTYILLELREIVNNRLSENETQINLLIFVTW